MQSPILAGFAVGEKNKHYRREEVRNVLFSIFHLHLTFLQLEAHVHAQAQEVGIS
jgi:hypothetical protein